MLPYPFSSFSSFPSPSSSPLLPFLPSSLFLFLSFSQDTYSGLMGPLITCREGVLDEKGRRNDVDYEFALLFLVFNENESWYLDDNIKKYLNKDPRDFRRSDDFEESNKMHGACVPGALRPVHSHTRPQDKAPGWHVSGILHPGGLPTCQAKEALGPAVQGPL